MGVTASVARFTENNANSSGSDLADLIKSAPRRKYGETYRPMMKKGVTFDFLGIVVFSEVDR